MKDRIMDFIDRIELEPPETKEPAGSVQIGRLQVCDELRLFLSVIEDDDA